MKLTTTALALVLAAYAVPAAAQYENRTVAPQTRMPEAPRQQDQQEATQGTAAKAGDARPSKGAMKAIVELQKAVNANDAANIPAKLAAAQAVASTKDDRYIIGQLHLKAALAANDEAGMVTAIDTIANSGFVDASRVSELYVALGSKFYNGKQFDRAATAFERATTLNPANTQALLNLAESRFSQGRKADAVALFQRAIQADLAAGRKPDERLYKRALGIAYDEKMPVAIDIARQWIAAYPSVDSWRNGIALYQNMGNIDVESALDVLRLLRATGAMSTAADYNLYITAAADQLNFNEAQAVLDEGIAAGKVDPSSALFRDTVAALKKKPKASDADLAEATKTAQSGMALLRIGDRYYGMGEYAKAVELYRQAMGKSGVDASLANLHIGMALARAGDKAGAMTALNAVSGNLQPVAKYWLIYVQQHG